MSDPYAMGPGPDYDPPPTEDLVDPEVHRSAAEKGRARCLAVLAECGIRKRENGSWNDERKETRHAHRAR